MKTKNIVMIVAAVAVAGSGGWMLFSKPTPKVVNETALVRKGTLIQTVQITGEVTSSADVDIKFELPGRIKTIAKKVGDAVKSGEILATLDDRDALVGVEKARAAVLSAQANLEKLRTGSTPEEIRVSEAAVASAESSLAQSRQSLADARQAYLDTKAANEASLAKTYSDLNASVESLYVKASASNLVLAADVFESNGNLRTDFVVPDSNVATQALTNFQLSKTALAAMASDVAKLRAETDRAAIDSVSSRIIANSKVARDAAQSAYAALQISVVISPLTQTALETRKTEVKNAWNDIQGAVTSAETQKLLTASTGAANVSTLSAAQAKINAAEQTVNVSDAALQSAKASLALRKASAGKYEIESAQAQLSQMRASLSEAELAFDKTRVRAPFDGVVSQVNGRVGNNATTVEVIMKVHGVDAYEIEASVPETDVAKLKTDMSAAVTLDAYGDDLKFSGMLVSIDTAQTVIQDVVYYKTRFQFASQDRPVRAGMTANIVVTTVSHADALILPLRAVRGDGSKYVRMIENGGEVKRNITVGVTGDDGQIEVASGLKEGDTVIVATRIDGKLQTQ